MIPEQANHLISIQRRKRWLQILLNCAKRQSVSCTSNFNGTKVWLPKTHNVPLQKWLSNLEDLPRNQSLETVPVCIVWQNNPHDNIVCIHMYDECKISIDSGVCHKLWSILWWIVQACSLTIEYQVFQFVPSISISEQFGSILVTILQQISILLLWSGGHRCMELILCRVVGSSCLLTHSIVPHISLHDQPCHKTMQKYDGFKGMVFFQFHPLKFAIQTWFCNCRQYLCLLSHCLWV